MHLSTLLFARTLLTSRRPAITFDYNRMGIAMARVAILVRVEAETRDRLAELAAADDRSISAYVRVLLAKVLEASPPNPDPRPKD